MILHYLLIGEKLEIGIRMKTLLSTKVQSRHRISASEASSRPRDRRECTIFKVNYNCFAFKDFAKFS